MGDETGIEWADSTWNPTVGCTKVSAGCDHCYAETFVNRFAGSKGFPNRFDDMLIRGEKFLGLPLTKKWAEPRKVFVNSLSDLFHKDVPDEHIAEVFAVMALAKQHTFQLLTKRHGRLRSLLSQERFTVLVADAVERRAVNSLHLTTWGFDYPLPNVWIGVSVEDQAAADLRIPALLQTPAAVRWLSMEPLLGGVDITPWLPRAQCPACLHDEATHYYGPGDNYGRTVGCQGGDGSFENPICGCRKLRGERDHILGDPYQNHGLHWVVVGGESGAGARPMHPDWARSVRDQCAAACVPFLFKQWGAWVGHAKGGRPADANGIREGRSPWADCDPDAYINVETGQPDEDNGIGMWRVGKKVSGRELDGRTHDGYPLAVPV